MSDWVYGFFMAWGMFLAIPCPKKIWRESARRKMLACLPLVGCIVGGVWVLCACLVQWLPGPLAAALLAAAPWLATGFLHLDGFMDVCDAVMSCGAFAVICMVLLALGQWSAFLSARSLPLWGLALIPVASRSCASLAVLTLRPLGSSQYSEMARGGGPVWFAAACLAASVVLPLVLAGSFGPLAAAVGYGLAVWYGFRQLDGMSGDVSGFALTVGELWGVLALAIGR